MKETKIKVKYIEVLIIILAIVLFLGVVCLGIFGMSKELKYSRSIKDLTGYDICNRFESNVFGDFVIYYCIKKDKWGEVISENYFKYDINESKISDMRIEEEIPLK